MCSNSVNLTDTYYRWTLRVSSHERGLLAFMFSERAEKILLFSATAVLAVGLYLFLNDSLFFKKRGADLDQIATVNKSLNDVRVKGEKELEFFPVNKADTLYNQDTVYSGENSYADISLNTGGAVKLNPKSMVILRKKGKKMAFEVNQGEFLGKLMKNQKIHLASQDSIQTITGEDNSDFLVNKTDSGVEIKVLTGKVELNTSNGKQSLKKNQKVEISDKGESAEMISSSIELISPVYADVRWRKKETPTTFRWKASQKMGAFKLLLSRDKKFKDIVFEKSSKDSQVSLLLPADGTYYWKVTAISHSGASIESDPFVFTSLTEKAPDLIEPTRQAEFLIPSNGSQQKKRRQKILGENKFPVSFEFRDKYQASGYKIEVARDRSFKNITFKKVVSDNRLENIYLSEGQYYWRVIALDKRRLQADWSQARSFTVMREEEPLRTPVWFSAKTTITIPNQEYPKFLYKAGAKKIRDYLLEKGIVNSTLSWSRSRRALSYELVVSEMKRHRDSENTFEINKNSYKLQDLNPGRYELKVRAINAKQMSPWSELHILEVRLEPPRTLSKELIKAPWSEDLQKKGAANLRWSPLLFAESYEIVISRRQDFKGAKSFTTKKTWYPFMVYFNRQYYWKVRALNKHYQPVSSYSKTFKLRVKKKVGPIIRENELNRTLASSPKNIKKHWENSSEQPRNEFQKGRSPRSTFESSYIWWEAYGAFTRHDYKDSGVGNSKLLSNTQPNFKMAWRERLEIADFEFSVEHRSIDLQSPQDTVIEGDLNFTEILVQVPFLISSQQSKNKSAWRIGPLMSYRVEPLIFGVEGNTLLMDSPRMLTLGATLENERVLSKKKGLDLNSRVLFWYSPQSSNELVSNGYGVKVDFRLMRSLGVNWKLSGGLTYDFQRYSLTQSDYAGQSLGAGFGLIYFFDEKTFDLKTERMSEDQR